MTKEMISKRVTDTEIKQAVRNSGQNNLEKILTVILETDGTLSVIPLGDNNDLENNALFQHLDLPH